MPQTKSSLIFIPDISGFTEFVNKTEISHSQHIVSELLELLIDADDLDMKVAEVEGDAVVFYKHQEVPPVQHLIDQSVKMFIRFHEHIRRYETQRICQCGACSTAGNLSLKFIVHQGPLGFTNIKNTTKPFGATLVLAHKLMKNEVPKNEYILFSDAFFGQDFVGIKEDPHIGHLMSCVSDYDKIGQVNYKYLSFAKLHSRIKDIGPLPPSARTKNPVIGKLKVNMPVQEVYQYLSDFELKKVWDKKILDIRYEKDRINRTGTKHVCILQHGTMKIETVRPDPGAHNIVYGEKTSSMPFIREMASYYFLDSDGTTTDIKIEIHYVLIPIIGKLMKPFIKRKMERMVRDFITSFPGSMQ
jgi:hypothetical protein